MERPKRAAALAVQTYDESNEERVSRGERSTSKRESDDEVSMDFDDDDAADTSAAKRPRGKAVVNKEGGRRSARATSAAVATYREADSDDEFAQSHFMVDEDEDEGKKGAGRQRKRQFPAVAATMVAEYAAVAAGGGNEEGESAKPEAKPEPEPEAEAEAEPEAEAEEEEEESDDDNTPCGGDIEYKIQHMLGRWAMPASEWAAVCGKMHTREVTRGSVLQQPDAEFCDPSPDKVEKFLVKWAHASYLHVSWETERDLVDLVGAAAFAQHFKKLKERELKGPELFDDLAPGEFFPHSHVTVERVLQVDDDDVDVQAIDWRTVPRVLPVVIAAAPEGGAEDQKDSEEQKGEEGQKEDEEQQEVVTAVAAVGKGRSRSGGRRGKGRVATAAPLSSSASNQALHGPQGWALVKWEGQPYSEASYEYLPDLAAWAHPSPFPEDRRSASGDASAAGIEYEQALREFYRREQCAPAKMTRSGTRRFNRTLDAAVLACDTPPAFTTRGKGTVNGGGPDDLQLRDYQWEGVRWMLFNWAQKRNSILADEMGLGKTIQTAAFLQLLHEHQGLRGPFLIVCPLSVCLNWQREMAAWTDLDAIVYHGSAEDRKMLRDFEFRYVTRAKDPDAFKLQVVITTPETCMACDTKTATGRGRRALSNIQWDVLVVDEAHKLKNHDSKITACLRDEYTYQNCLLLTGTPLQNDIHELYSLLNFVARDDFADRAGFAKEFGELRSAAQLQKLHARLKPYLLRREKDVVEKSVPPKEEIIIDVELTVPQKQYYRAIYEMNTAFLFKGEAKVGPRSVPGPLYLNPPSHPLSHPHLTSI